MARFGRKVSRGFEVGSDRFNLATLTAGSVLSANCNPVSPRLGSFVVRDLPLSALGFKTAETLRETFGNFPGAEGLYSRTDASLRYGEAAEFNVPLGLRFPETPDSLEGPGTSAEMLYANGETVRDNLLTLETSIEMERAVRHVGLDFVAGRVADLLRANLRAVFAVEGETFFAMAGPGRAETILPPPINPDLATLDEIAAGRYLPENPAEYDRSPFRGDTSPEIPSARGVVSEVPAEVPAVPCAETVPAPETSDNPDAGIALQVFACPCGKSYAHSRSLARHARTCTSSGRTSEV